MKGDTPKEGERVLVHYEGRLSDGTVFDSSYDRREAYLFSSGVGDVIRGWNIAM